MDLQQANALLLARREALGIVPKYTAVPAPMDRPNFEQQALWLIEQARERDGLKPQEKRITAIDTFSTLPTAQTEAKKPTAVVVKNYPLLGLAILNQKLTAVYRVWLLCRHLDRDGRGWLDLSEVRTAVTKGYALFKYRQYRHIICQGNGIFWTESNGRLWLASVARLAIALGVARVGKPVKMPLEKVVGELAGFNASIYAAWDTRKRPSPISRAKRAKVLGVSERTQRHYCRIAGVKRVRNYAIVSPSDNQAYAYEHGKAVFEFKDHKGRNGRKGRLYTARELPTTQQPSMENAKPGRTQKINQKINLVVKASRVKVQRLFFDNAKLAAKNAGRGNECFWLSQQASTYGLWSHFFIN